MNPVNKNVLILGLGAIGSNVGMTLSSWSDDLVIHGLDHDTVERRNIYTQAYPARVIGKAKPVAFGAELIYKFGMAPKGKFHYVHFDKFAGKGRDFDLIVDCFDNWESRRLAFEFSGKTNLLRLGFDFVNEKPVASALWNREVEDTKSLKTVVDLCDLREWSWWIKAVSCIFTGLIVDFISTGAKRNILIWDSLKISEI